MMLLKVVMFDSKAEMLQQLEQPSRSPATEKEPAPAVVGQFSGKVVGVTDGDTITVMHDGVGERIRLHGIDCPEKRQPFGNRTGHAVKVAQSLQDWLLMHGPEKGLPMAWWQAGSPPVRYRS